MKKQFSTTVLIKVCKWQASVSPVHMYQIFLPPYIRKLWCIGYDKETKAKRLIPILM